MSAPETLLIPLPQCPAALHRPISLDLNATSSGSRKMCYHSDMTISYCCGTVDNANAHSVARMTSQDVMTYGHYMRGSIFSVPKLWQVDNGESLVVSVYSYLKTFLGASGSNQGAIDNRIEQAMDLVKSHLMNAVRSEVDELKERIVKLEEIIAQLQSENEFFRANVHRDVLLQLQQQQQQQALGSPASQQALQMIQQPSNQQQPPQI